MKIYKLFYNDKCVECASVLLYIKNKNLNVNIKNLDISKNEHKTTEFKDINPMYILPLLEVTFNNNTQYISNAKVILKYLDNQYGQPYVPILDEDKWLYWANDCLLNSINNVDKIQFNNPNKIRLLIDLNEKIKYLDSNLNGKKFILGKHESIADFKIIAIIYKYFDLLSGLIDFNENKNINNWMDCVKLTINDNNWTNIISNLLN